MKKLIMAAAAITAGFAMADVVSSSVVGYQEFSVNDGYGMTTATFAPISGDSISLQSIVPTGSGVGGYGDVVIQTMNASGEWTGEYWYYTVEGAGYPEDGWYDVNDEKVSVEIPYKQGVMIQAGADVKITYSGAVAEGTIEANIPNGYSMTGNPTPVAIDIQGIKPVGEGVGGYGDVVIQTMNAAGEWEGEYWYYTVDGAGYPEDGWYDVNDEKAVCTINPGVGVMIQTSADGVTLQYPGAL